MKRVLIIIAGLAVTGAVVGGVLGAVAMALVVMIRDVRVFALTGTEALIAGATFGVVAGAILAPIAAWTLMRSVPLWRAIGEPAIGTTLGAAIATLLAPVGVAGPIFGGILGFIAAAVRLRIAYGRKKRAPVAVAEPD